LTRQFLGNDRKRITELTRRAKENLRREESEVFKKRSLAQLEVISEYGDDADELSERVTYHVPLHRESQAWRIFTEQMKHGLGGAALRPEGNRLNVALVVSGGIGDVLKASVLIRPFARAFDATFTVVTDQRGAFDIFKDNPDVCAVFVPTFNSNNFIDEYLRHIPIFDLIISFKYVTYFNIPPGSRLTDDAKNYLLHLKTDHGEYLKKYTEFGETWPRYNYGLCRYLIKNGLHIVDVARETAGLIADPNQTIDFFLKRKDFLLVETYLHRPYVTIHNGFDTGALPSTTLKNDYATTKNISIKKWAKIVAALNTLGVDVVQLGVAAEKAVPGVTHCFNGLTTMAETAAIQKGALCHIDTEGGLVHLAHAVHTRSVVLFGPTSPGVFGYDSNINLEPTRCGGCAYTTDNWVVQCPRFTEGPDCMDEHAPQDVVEAVKRIVEERGEIYSALKASSELDADLTATVLAAAAQGATDGKRHVVVVADVAAFRDIRGALSELASQASILVAPTLTEADTITPQGAREYDHCSYYNLALPDQSIDKLVLVGDLAMADLDYALRECVRTVSDGGQIDLISTTPIPHGRLKDGLAACGVPLTGHKDGASENHIVLTFRKSAIQRSADEGTGATPDAKTAFEVLPYGELSDEENAMALDAAFKDVQAERRLHDEAWAIADQMTYPLRSEGWIDLRLDFAHNFFIDGWNAPDDVMVWSSAKYAEMQLPVPRPTIHGEAVFAKIELDVTMLSLPQRDGRVLRVLSDGDVLGTFVINGNDLVAVEVPGKYVRYNGLLGLVLEVDTLAHSEGDPRDLGVGLSQMRCTLFPTPQTVS
jgi:ADP-heptose:LPS heptosyltransferase